jgi:hypothetical protein
MKKVLNLSDKFKEYISEFQETSEISKILLGEIETNLLVDDHIDYISVSSEDANKISYLTPERINAIKKSGEDLWTSSKRYHCKSGSFVSKVLKSPNSKSVEIFSNQYKSYVTKKEFTFKVISGDEIAKYYLADNYSAQKGTLGASCMKYEKCKPFFELYSKNPETIKMLIMVNSSDLLIGRALLWEAQSMDGETINIMDRIYTVKDEDYSHFFKNWAHSNGYSYKFHQNWANTLQFIDPKTGQTSEVKLKIKLKESIFGRYPYLDTFKWIDKGNNILYNFIPSEFNPDDSRYRLLMSPEGGSEYPDYLAFDEITRNWSYKGDMVRLESGLTTNMNNCAWSDTLDRYILQTESTWNRDLQDNIYTDISRVDTNMIIERVNILERSMSLSKLEVNRILAVFGIKPKYTEDNMIDNNNNNNMKKIKKSRWEADDYYKNLNTLDGVIRRNIFSDYYTLYSSDQSSNQILDESI